ncbi:hypothetical protein EV421DRAFT_1733894 [Armillaria borealis]|uniref:Uncharacterized protein n=1 Tax=Armillaria borealis TaxID=47425 RepID=A0AA39MU16_9AGAR|nr:hypothetical protein EV421DRAFT_1733894 [Armillaria borealis]
MCQDIPMVPRTSEGIHRAVEAFQGCIPLTRSPWTVFLVHPVASRVLNSDHFTLHPDDDEGGDGRDSQDMMEGWGGGHKGTKGRGSKIGLLVSNDSSDDDIHLDINYPPMDALNETKTMPTQAQTALPLPPPPDSNAASCVLH